eukprot:6573271-Pyramimonas_sp.AAC.1
MFILGGNNIINVPEELQGGQDADIAFFNLIKSGKYDPKPKPKVKQAEAEEAVRSDTPTAVGSEEDSYTDTSA